MVELLQRAVVLSEKEEIASAAGMSNTSNSVASPTSASTADDEGAEEGEGIEVEVITGGSRHAPSLHRLASLFLRSRSAFMLFNGCAMVHFTSLLIGYALAWSKAFCQVRLSIGRCKRKLRVPQLTPLCPPSSSLFFFYYFCIIYIQSLAGLQP